MSDPYRPAYYTPSATAGSPYNPQDYNNSDSYGPLTTQHRPSHSGSSGYYPQSQTQMTHNRRESYDDDGYLSPQGTSHRSHRSRSRSSRHEHGSHHHSRRHSPDEDRPRSRSHSHSRLKEAGATAVGGAAGAVIGHKIGHGNIGTIAGLAVGALGARALEQQFEKRGEKKRLEREFEGGVDYIEGKDDRRRGADGRPGTRERRKSFVEQAQDKVSGFLGVGDGGDKRRSRSHVGGSSRSARYEDSDSEGSEYEKRGSRRGGRRDDW